MTIDEIKALTLDGIEARIAEIEAEKETTEDLDALEAECRALLDRKTELLDKQKKDRAAVLAGAGEVIGERKEDKKMDIKELRSSQAYIDAFANMIKTGKQEECRALLSEIGDSSNGVPVPVIVEDAVQTAWSKAGNLSARARQMFFKGILTVPYEASATAAAVHTEGTSAPAEETLSIKSCQLIPANIKKWITISDELLGMKSDVFLMYIYDEITHQILKALDNAVVTDLTADSNDNGLVSTAIVSTPSASTIFEGLAAISGEAANPIIVMNKKVYFGVFMALKDTTGRPIYNIVSENGKPSYYLNGVEVEFNDSMPATATGKYAVIGDMEGYTINYPNGSDVAIVTDALSLAEKDLVKFVGKLGCGHGITRPNYFAVIKDA